MRCDGVRTSSQECCGSLLYRCKDCGHQGCNQGADGQCSKQAFKSARCKSCNKIGTNRMVKDAADAQVSG